MQEDHPPVLKAMKSAEQLFVWGEEEMTRAVPLFRLRGYQESEQIDIALPNGAVLPVVRMIKELSAPSG